MATFFPAEFTGRSIAELLGHRPAPQLGGMKPLLGGWGDKAYRRC